MTIQIDLPPLYPKQYDAIFAPERYSVIAASTKAGKTMGCIVWQIAQVFNIPGEHWWIAPVYQQAKIAYRRAKRYLDPSLYKSNDSELTLTFSNGSRWVFRSAEKPDNLYGEDVESAVIDEASRMREEAWFAIRSTLTATQGQVRIIGNVKGRGNWFYKLGEKAKQGAAGYAYHKLTAYDAVAGGALAMAEIQDAKDALPDYVFRELYLAEPSEDGTNPFGITSIDAAWMDDFAPGPVVAWGWDVAKKRDWTVGVGLDAECNVSRLVRFRHAPWPEVTGTILRETDASAYVDSTGTGDTILDYLWAEAADPMMFNGYLFTQKSKQQLMEGLALAIQEGTIGLFGDVLRSELEAFEYVVTRTGTRYAAPEGYGLHDDCVMALAMALRAYQDFPHTRGRTLSMLSTRDPSPKRQGQRVSVRRARNVRGF